MHCNIFFSAVLHIFKRSRQERFVKTSVIMRNKLLDTSFYNVSITHSKRVMMHFYCHLSHASVLLNVYYCTITHRDKGGFLPGRDHVGHNV